MWKERVFFCYLPFSSNLQRVERFLLVFAVNVHDKPDMIDIVSCECAQCNQILNRLYAYES